MGFADSKTLSSKNRESLFEEIKKCDFIGWFVDVISPEELSAQMLRRLHTFQTNYTILYRDKCSLNTVSHNSAVGLIRKVLEMGVRLRQVLMSIEIHFPAKHTRFTLIQSVLAMSTNESYRNYFPESSSPWKIRPT